MNKKAYCPPAARQLVLTSIVATPGPAVSYQVDRAAHAPIGKDEKLSDGRWNDDFMSREWDDDWDDEE